MISVRDSLTTLVADRVLHESGDRAVPDTNEKKLKLKKTLIAKYSSLSNCNDFDVNVLTDVCFRLVYVSMELGHWKDAENYSKEMLEFIRIPDDADAQQRQLSSALRGACEFYVGINLYHQRDILGSIRHYKTAMKLFGNPQAYPVSYARLQLRLGDSVLALAGWKKISTGKSRAFLTTSWRHYSIAAEAFRLGTHATEWEYCVKSCMSCLSKLATLDNNKSVLMTYGLQFLKRQLQRTDLPASAEGRTLLNWLMQSYCGKRVDNSNIIADTNSKAAQIAQLKDSISKLEPGDARKSEECSLAALYMQVGENLNAVFILQNTLIGASWDKNPNLMSYCFAIIGVAWLNMGDAEAALPYLRDAEVSFNTPFCRDDYMRIQAKRIEADSQYDALKKAFIPTPAPASPKKRSAFEAGMSMP